MKFELVRFTEKFKPLERHLVCPGRVAKARGGAHTAAVADCRRLRDGRVPRLGVFDSTNG